MRNEVIRERGRFAAAAAALISAAFFGLNAVASKTLYAPAAAARLDAIDLFVVRGLWTLPLFLGLALITRPRRAPPVNWSNATVFLVCGITYGPGTIVLSALAVRATSASHAVILLSLLPLVAASLAAIFLHERITVARAAAMAIGVVGAGALVLSKSTSGATPGGDVLMTCSMLAWGLLTVGIRKLDRAYPPLFVVGVFGTVGTALVVLIGAALGRLDAGLIPLQHFDVRTIVSLDLELILLLSLGGQFLQSTALRRLDVALTVALTSYGSIVFGLVGAILLLGEHLDSGDIAAGILLVTALGLSVIPMPRHRG